MVLAKDVRNFIVGRRRGILSFLLCALLLLQRGDWRAWSARARWVLGSFWFDCSVSFFGREALVALQALGCVGSLAVALVPGPLLLLDSFEKPRAGSS